MSVEAKYWKLGEDFYRREAELLLPLGHVCDDCIASNSHNVRPLMVRGNRLVPLEAEPFYKSDKRVPMMPLAETWASDLEPLVDDTRLIAEAFAMVPDDLVELIEVQKTGDGYLVFFTHDDNVIPALVVLVAIGYAVLPDALVSGDGERPSFFVCGEGDPRGAEFVVTLPADRVETFFEQAHQSLSSYFADVLDRIHESCSR